MKKQFTLMRFYILAVACFCFAGAGLAQDPQAPQADDKPKPAAKAYGPIGAEDQDPTQTPADTMQPDDRPLTGFQLPTVGTPIEKHSYWVPGVSYYNFVQSNGQGQGGGNSWNSTSYIAGSVSLLKQWSRSQLALNYSGGGSFSTNSALGNGFFHQFGASQVFNWERLQLTFLDQFAYLPQSQFGFGAGTGIALPGVGGSLGPVSTGLGGGIDPGQSVFTAFGPRYTNLFGVQGNYTLTARSSITFGGIDSILRFRDPGNIESNEYLGSLGYNYQFTREDTLGVVYRYSSYHFIGFTQNIGDQSIQLAYGRKITGRLGLQLSGGPEFTHLRVAVPAGGSTHKVAGTASASISYAIHNGNLSASYFHGTTAGSGVFLGSTTDQLNGAITKKITRLWTGNANLGYARNRGILGTSAIANTNINFDTIYAGVGAGRPLGHNANLSLGYTAYIERTNGSCGGSGCGSNFTTNQLTVGVSWHTRPFILP